MCGIGGRERRFLNSCALPTFSEIDFHVFISQARARRCWRALRRRNAARPSWPSRHPPSPPSGWATACASCAPSSPSPPSCPPASSSSTRSTRCSVRDSPRRSPDRHECLAMGNDCVHLSMSSASAGPVQSGSVQQNLLRYPEHGCRQYGCSRQIPPAKSRLQNPACQSLPAMRPSRLQEDCTK